jgi:RimJ/RimL family protein N-acetyltransferase
MTETTLHEREDILTERLRLRRFRPSDAALVELHASDRRVALRTERIPHPYPPGLAASFIDRMRAADSDEIGWAIDLGDDEAGSDLIGTIMLRMTSAESARIGYWLAPALWNAGYASEAAEAVVGFAARAGLREVTARVF